MNARGSLVNTNNECYLRLGHNSVQGSVGKGGTVDSWTEFVFVILDGMHVLGDVYSGQMSLSFLSISISFCLFYLSYKRSVVSCPVGHCCCYLWLSFFLHILSHMLQLNDSEFYFFSFSQFNVAFYLTISYDFNRLFFFIKSNISILLLK